MKKSGFLLVLLCCLVGMIAQADRTTIYDIQYTTDPSGDSPMNGQNVTVSGIVSATFFTGYVIAEESGPWHAIYIYSQKNGPDVGDEVEVSGRVSEYYGMTEISNITAYTLLSTGNTVDPVVLDTQSVSQEQYESVLVRVPDVTVTNLLDHREWQISDGSAPARCDDKNDYMYFPQTGDYLQSVTGVVFYDFSNFKIEPRNTADIVGDVIPHYALKGDIVTMNDSRDVLPDAYVEILGDRIVSVGQTPPQRLQIIDTQGLIFPGLIDAHNHPIYNVLDIIPFPCTFADRSEWHDYPMYADFSTQFRNIRGYGGSSYAQATNLWKLAEVRALCAGTTMIQGYNCNGDDNNDIAHEGMIINNAERFPSRVYSSTFPLEHQSDWTYKRDQFWDRFVIHLSEGVSSAALAELNTWQAWGMLDWRTTIIHGVPYTEPEWNLLADENVHLIWSPMSNWVLYESTADVPGALAAGVSVTLAPDWTESGTPNMLAEMKFANNINNQLWGGQLTPQQFAEFVTRNAAEALAMEDRAGQVAPGFEADIMVIYGAVETPYQSLLDANPVNVKLTVVDGRPMYGDEDLMAQFSFIGQMEDINICGQVKKLAIRIPEARIPDCDKSFSEVMSDLEEAYDASYPKVCDFIGYDPCNGTVPTPTPTGPTPTPTTTPTGPAFTPTPTPTQALCDELGVTIAMPGTDFGPGDSCYIEAHVCNPSSVTYVDIPLFVILDVYGSLYFAPSFSEFDNYIIEELTPGTYIETVISEFQWPEGAGSATGIVLYGAMTNKDITALFGTYDAYTFGWHE